MNDIEHYKKLLTQYKKELNDISANINKLEGIKDSEEKQLEKVKQEMKDINVDPNNIESIIDSKVKELKQLEDEYNKFKPASTDEADILSAAKKYHPSGDVSSGVDIDFNNIF